MGKKDKQIDIIEDTTLRCKASACLSSWNHRETIWNNNIIHIYIYIYNYVYIYIYMYVLTYLSILYNAICLYHPALFTSLKKLSRADGHNNVRDPLRGSWLFFLALSHPWSLAARGEAGIHKKTITGNLRANGGQPWNKPSDMQMNISGYCLSKQTSRTPWLRSTPPNKMES